MLEMGHAHFSFAPPGDSKPSNAQGWQKQAFMSSANVCCRAVAFLVGVWVLLAPAVMGHIPFVAAAPLLTAACAAWLLSAFCAAAVAPLAPLPLLLQSLGLYCGSGTSTVQPAGALTGLLIVVVALGGLTRSRLQPTGNTTRCSSLR